MEITLKDFTNIIELNETLIISTDTDGEYGEISPITIDRVEDIELWLKDDVLNQIVYDFQAKDKHTIKVWIREKEECNDDNC